MPPGSPRPVVPPWHPASRLPEPAASPALLLAPLPYNQRGVGEDLRLSKVGREGLTLSMAVGPPSGGALPATNNERKGLGPALHTVFPLTEDRGTVCTGSRTVGGRMCRQPHLPHLGALWPGTDNTEALPRPSAQFPTRFL